MGKSLLLVMLCAACAHNVDAGKRTGEDGRIKGAKQLRLENNVGKQRDIVTYPGGDRVDWKKIVLPENERGTLDLTMTYTTPRQGLKVAFDVYDRWQRPVKETLSGRGRNKSMTIDQASGTYFIRVHAPRRGDAATYVVEASFVPEPTLEDTGMDKVPVADPPRLPPVPEPDLQCLVAYDPTNSECAKTCAPGSPKKHPPCQAPPDPNAPAPLPPPPPPEVAKPVIARVLTKELQHDGTIIVTLGAGSDHGVGKEWTKGSLLKGDTKDPKVKYPNGSVTVLQVNRNTTRVRLRQGITSDILKENDKVVLEP